MRSQEMSVRGTLGAQASAKSRRGLYSRAKKSRPASSGMPSMQKNDSSIDSSSPSGSSSESEDQENTLNYFDNQDGKGSLNV